MVRAKFKLIRYETSLYSREKRNTDGSPVIENGVRMYEQIELRTLHFQPVFGNSDPHGENSKFFAMTPSGEVKLGMVSPEAWSKFELGKDYYLDFSPSA